VEVALAWTAVVAVIDEEDDENGNTVHPLPLRILSLLYPPNVPPALPMPRLTDPSPHHQEGEIVSEPHHRLAQMRRHGVFVDAVA